MTHKLNDWKVIKIIKSLKRSLARRVSTHMASSSGTHSYQGETYYEETQLRMHTIRTINTVLLHFRCNS